jgi:hypothetical protein
MQLFLFGFVCFHYPLEVPTVLSVRHSIVKRRERSRKAREVKKEEKKEKQEKQEKPEK